MIERNAKDKDEYVADTGRYDEPSEDHRHRARQLKKRDKPGKRNAKREPLRVQKFAKAMDIARDDTVDRMHQCNERDGYANDVQAPVQAAGSCVEPFLYHTIFSPNLASVKERACAEMLIF
jgi:hypothetical protein